MDIEREYNARARVPEHPEFFARWERDSAFVRSTLPCTLDIPYGSDPRQRFDWFPATPARGTLVFIHGGYWRSLDRALFSWLAAPYVAAGLNVAMPSYRLCPAVRIDQIVEDVLAAMDAIAGRAAGPITVAGHTAGGHLVGAVFAAPRGRLALDTTRIAGGVSLSGLFDFAPLVGYSGNADFRLDAAAVERLNLYDKRPVIRAPLVVAVGGDESGEFQRQSRLLAERWSPQARPVVVLPGVHHFSIVDAFAERGQPLHQATLALF